MEDENVSLADLLSGLEAERQALWKEKQNRGQFSLIIPS